MLEPPPHLNKTKINLKTCCTKNCEKDDIFYADLMWYKGLCYSFMSSLKINLLGEMGL